jgi:hypothetical protein
MKKVIPCLLLLLLANIIFLSCSDTKSYADMLEDEKKAIAAYIKDNSIQVISQTEFYDQDSVTNDNEYVQLASGVYMHIIDKGSTNKADTVKSGDHILARFTEYDILSKDTTLSNVDDVARPDEFLYRVTSTQIAGQFISGYMMTAYSNTVVPAGWLQPLAYVRDRAHVRLIVPAKMGHGTAQSSVTPYYYDLKYQIYK